MDEQSINIAEFNKAKRERDEWHNAWFEAHALVGKAYWDGATWGYTKGLEDRGPLPPKDQEGCTIPDCPRHKYVSSPYGIGGRAPEIARSVSILLDTYITAHLDVGMEVAPNDPVMNDMLPLTYFMTRYNTGDEILFQYVAGKQKVVRIKTHDGLFMDTDGVVVRSPRSDVYYKYEEATDQNSEVSQEATR